MFKKGALIGISVIVLILAALVGNQLLGGATTTQVLAAAEEETQTIPRTMIVVGQGKVSSQPDIAMATVGVQVTSPDIKEATSEASATMEEIMAALKAMDIADSDIQTTSYSINYERRPDFEVRVSPESDATEPEGRYHVSNMVNIKIRDLDKVGQVLDEVVNAGANSIWGVNFGIDDMSELESEARAKAVEDARARAEELAELSGVKLGSVIQVSEIVGSSAYVAGYVVPEMAARVMGGGAGPTSPGELQVTTQLQITFAIE